MSYFDEIIPKSCATCFHWDGQKWVQIDPGLCDECDYMLDMFPVLNANKETEGENLRLLAIVDAPEWTFHKKQ